MTHPVTEPAKTTDWTVDDDPCYWTGTASMPRFVQFERTSERIHQLAWDQSHRPAGLGRVLILRYHTDAYLPEDHFDQVRQAGNWTVAQRAGGYIALWSWRAPTWRTYDPAVDELPGDGQAIRPRRSGGRRQRVDCRSRYRQDRRRHRRVRSLRQHPSPGIGGLTLASPSPGTHRRPATSPSVRPNPFTVGGPEQQTRDFPRHDSPWGKRPRYPSTRYTLHWGRSGWALWTSLRCPGRPGDAFPGPPRVAVAGADHLHVFQIVDALVRAGEDTVAFTPDGSLVDAYRSWRNDSTEAQLTEILDDPAVDVIVTAAVLAHRAAITVAGTSCRQGCRQCQTRGHDPCPAGRGHDALAGQRGRRWTVVFTERFENRAIAEAVRLARSGAVGKIVRIAGCGPHSLDADRRPDWFWDPRPAEASSHLASPRSTSSWRGGRPRSGRMRSSAVGNMHTPIIPTSRTSAR